MIASYIPLSWACQYHLHVISFPSQFSLTIFFLLYFTQGGQDQCHHPTILRIQLLLEAYENLGTACVNPLKSKHSNPNARSRTILQRAYPHPARIIPSDSCAIGWGLGGRRCYIFYYAPYTFRGAVMHFYAYGWRWFFFGCRQPLSLPNWWCIFTHPVVSYQRSNPPYPTPPIHTFWHGQYESQPSIQ